MLYSIKIKSSGRYILWCDKCWYQTSGEECRLFSKEEAEKIAKLLESHYVYAVTISNGEETYDIPGETKKPVVTTAKKKNGVLSSEMRKKLYKL